MAFLFSMQKCFSFQEKQFKNSVAIFQPKMKLLNLVFNFLAKWTWLSSPREPISLYNNMKLIFFRIGSYILVPNLPDC